MFNHSHIKVWFDNFMQNYVFNMSSVLCFVFIYLKISFGDTIMTYELNFLDFA